MNSNYDKNMPALKTPSLKWLFTGREIFPAMLTAMATAQKSIQLETYTNSDGRIGRQFLKALAGELWLAFLSMC
jgi:phosphatidylserine/phosphatidylglycerophosphate/cardiolipin synthase-like enzyme